METAIRKTEANGLPIKFDIEFKPFRLDSSLPEDFALDKASLLVVHTIMVGVC